MKSRLTLAFLLGVSLCLCTAIAGEKVLSVPVNVTGTLSSTDPKVNIETLGGQAELPAKTYEVKLTGGKLYNLIADTKFDSVIAVFDKTGKQVAFDDDSAGSLDAMLPFSPKETDTYKVAVAALIKDGAYRLRITEAKLLDVGGGLKLNGDIVIDNKVGIYNVKFAQGKSYTIEMIAAEDAKNLDPFIRVIGPGGKLVAQDDDSGGGLNARAMVEASEAGTYHILATTIKAGGKYTLTVQEK